MLGNFFFSSTGEAAAYEIEQSLRFDGSAYLSWTPGSGANRDAWTISCWVKRARNGVEEDVFSHDGSNQLAFDLGGDFVDFEQYYAKYQDYKVTSAGKYRDPSAWYHFVIVWDSLNSTTDDRKRLYINGERIPNSSTNSASSGFNDDVPSGKDSVFFDSSSTLYIGGTSGRRFQGYIAEVHGVNGSALDATSFGEYDDNGVWRPIAYSGSYGSEGFYLKFDPDATNGVGHDHSGNGNNWTASGFTTTGAQRDTVTDTPTDNHCTLNPIEETEVGYESDFEFSEGNLKIAFPSSPPTDHVCGTLFSTGAWYAEIECISVTRYAHVNVLEPEAMGFVGSRPGKRTNPASGYSYSNSGTITHNNTEYTGHSTWTAGDVIGIACNVDGNSLRFYKNGTLEKSFTTTRTEPMTIGCDGTDGSGNSSSFFVNCGQQPYQYTPPTGFTALSTKNIPAPAIADPATAFDVVTYEGTGTTNTLTVDFSPNFAWIKRYDGTGENVLVDTLRGSSPPARLISNSTGAELTASDGVNSFSSTGVVLDGTGGGGGDVNQTTRNYWAAQWDGNGTGSSNTSGSTTSTVSANATAGFSIISWSSPSSGSTTVGHGLGVAPDFVIAKLRNVDTHWRVWHKGLSGGTYTLFLGSSGAQQVQSDAFGAVPTSTVLNIGSDFSGSGRTCIAYSFVSVPGYSKFGTYEGNGNSNGPFVYLGFKPKFIIFKNIDSSNRNWSIMNSLRIPYNGTYARTRADSNGGESAVADSASAIDILSNGFKLKGDSSNTNRSGETHMYAAFAENPFGGVGVSPATAR